MREKGTRDGENREGNRDTYKSTKVMLFKNVHKHIASNEVKIQGKKTTENRQIYPSCND